MTEGLQPAEAISGAIAQLTAEGFSAHRTLPEAQAALARGERGRIAVVVESWSGNTAMTEMQEAAGSGIVVKGWSRGNLLGVLVCELSNTSTQG